MNSHAEAIQHDIITNNLYEQAVIQMVNGMSAKVFQDGNQWCCLYGVNLQEGIAGFGDTPYLSMTDFYQKMHTPIK